MPFFKHFSIDYITNENFWLVFHFLVNADADYSDQEERKPEGDQSFNEGHESGTRGNSFHGEEYLSDFDNRQRDYNLGYVSETEVIFIDSDNESVPGPKVKEGATSGEHSESDVKPSYALNVAVIKKEADSVASTTTTYRDLKMNLPAKKAEVIVIQPDSELDSEPDSTTRDTNMMEIQKPVSGEFDNVGKKNVVSDDKHACVCNLVKYMLKKSKVTIKTTSAKTCSAETFNNVLGNDSSVKQSVRVKEEAKATEEESNIDWNLAHDHEAGTGRESNLDVTSSCDKYIQPARPTETHETDNDDEEAGPSGIVEDAVVTESDTEGWTPNIIFLTVF